MISSRFGFLLLLLLVFLGCLLTARCSPTDQPLYDELTASQNEFHVSLIQKDPGNWKNGLILGDSITAMFNRSEYGADLRSRGVFLSGIGGNRIEQALARIENGLLDSDNYCPKRILFEIGTNNLVNKNNTPWDIVHGIDHLANRCISVCPDTKVHVLSILPRSGLTQPHVEQIVFAVNKGLLDLFRFRNSRNIEFDDVTHAFQAYNGTNLRLNRALYVEDGVHLNLSGQGRLFPFLLGIFKV